jgi:hypothetical protein
MKLHDVMTQKTVSYNKDLQRREGLKPHRSYESVTD